MGAQAVDLARAKALLERTHALMAAIEEEVARLHAETEAAKRRLIDWEDTLRALLPDEERAEGAVVSVAGPETHETSVHGVVRTE